MYVTEANTNSEYLQQLDAERRLACTQNNISLVEIPFNWDKTIQNLYDKIRQVNPQIDVKTPI